MAPPAALALALPPLLLLGGVRGDPEQRLARFSHGSDLTAPAKPSDTRGELDDWQLLEPGDFLERFLHHVSAVLVLGLIGIGAWARSNGVLPRHRADSLRRVCFMCLLPAFLLRHIWLCQLDSELYVVAAWSFLFHGLWLAMSVRASQALEPRDRQLRGWTMLMSQGAMNSFLYPLLLRHEDFGEKSLACAVLWDMGGNMWICQFALFAIAAYFKPGALGDEAEGGFDDEDHEEGEQLLPPGRRHHELAEFPGKMGARPPGKATNGSEAAAPECLPRPILIDALQQPVLICCVLGFLLNLIGAPLPAVADTPLWVVGEPYKLALYFLVGYYGDHNVPPQDVGRMLRALGVRYSISATIMALVLVALPLAPVYRYTVALALLSPTSSYLIHLVGEHGYGEGLMRLTICGGFVSTIVSTIAQNLLIGALSSG